MKRLCAVMLLASAASVASQQRPRPIEWSHAGGDAAQTTYSTAADITAANVRDLELWLLHAHGVRRPGAGRRAERRGPRLVFAAATNTQAGSSSGYFGPSGALQQVLQPPSGSTLSGVDWAELQWRLPLVVASSVILTQGVAIHERHGGSGSPATIRARFPLRPIQLTSTSAVINPAPLAAVGLPVTWDPDPAVLGHASPATPVSTTVGFDGVARLTLAPNPEAAQGRGVVVSDSGRTFIRFDYGAYEDRTSENASMTTSAQFGSVNLGGLLKARSIWYVTVTRTKAN